MNEATLIRLRAAGAMIGETNLPEWQDLVDNHPVDVLTFAAVKARQKSKARQVTAEEVAHEIGWKLKGRPEGVDSMAVPSLTIEARLARAERELIERGWQDLGGERWKPPLGPRPDFAAFHISGEEMGGELDVLLERLIDAYAEHHEVVINPRPRRALKRAAQAVFPMDPS